MHVLHGDAHPLVSGLGQVRHHSCPPLAALEDEAGGEVAAIIAATGGDHRAGALRGEGHVGGPWPGEGRVGAASRVQLRGGEAGPTSIISSSQQDLGTWREVG